MSDKNLGIILIVFGILAVAFILLASGGEKGETFYVQVKGCDVLACIVKGITDDAEPKPKAIHVIDDVYYNTILFTYCTFSGELEGVYREVECQATPIPTPWE